MNGAGSFDELQLAGVDFAGNKLVARFINGSRVSVDVSRYPRREQATAKQRNKWRLIGRGSGMQWENLDEDLSGKSTVRQRQKSGLNGRRSLTANDLEYLFEED